MFSLRGLVVLGIAIQGAMAVAYTVLAVVAMTDHRLGMAAHHRPIDLVPDINSQRDLREEDRR